MILAAPLHGGPALKKMLNAFPHAQQKSNGWWAHADNPTFDFIEQENGSITIHSWTGRTQEDILRMGGLKLSDIGPIHGYRRPHYREPFDLLALSKGKLIHWRFLESLGLQDGYKYHGRACVKIPYHREDGTQHTKIKVRKALNGKGRDKQSWDEGTPGEIIPYGLHKLDIARKQGYLLIGEGESDAWACWLHEVPYLGLPGSSSQKCLQGVNLNAIPRIYILQEPDQLQRMLCDGQGFYKNVHRALRQSGYQGELYCLPFEQLTGWKDPSELHIQLWPDAQAQGFGAVIEQALVHAIPANDANADIAQPADEALPEIILGGQLREMTAHALQALYRAEHAEPTLFVQSARLVQIARDENQRPLIRSLGVPEIKNELTRTANYYRIRKAQENEVLMPTTPPRELAEALLALDPSSWAFPALEAIIEAPVMRSDGSILDTPGYDPASHLYYTPRSAMDACKVPEQPTEEDVARALDCLEDVTGEFPYAEQADRANALALLFTPFLRPIIKRHIPLALINAPKQGTGKGLFADVVSIAATGESTPILTAPETEEEWDKRLTALLIQGRTIICIDNIPERLQSAKLDAVLTASTHEGRILGQSTMVKVPNRATWMATGNNIRLGGDLARRSYEIRLDPHVSQPWMRTGFKHEDLATYVTEHRSELITAILTIARAWYVAGQPIAAHLPALGTFTSWTKTVGSILAFAGIEGFLANLKKLYDEADEEGSQWEGFLHTWFDTFQSDYVTTKTLSATITAERQETSADGVAGGAFSDTLPTALQFALKEKPASFTVKLGKALEKRVDTCYGEANFRLERRRDTHSKQWVWHVVAGDAGGSPSHVRNEISEEDIIYENGRNNHPLHPQSENSRPPGSPPEKNVNQPVEPLCTLSGKNEREPEVLNTPPARQTPPANTHGQRGVSLSDNEGEMEEFIL